MKSIVRQNSHIFHFESNNLTLLWFKLILVQYNARIVKYIIMVC